MSRRIHPRDKVLLSLFVGQFVASMASTLQDSVQSLVNILDSRFGSHHKKTHRLVPMTHSYLFDCKLAKFFDNHGLKQCNRDPCVPYVQGQCRCLSPDGGSIFFSDFDEDIQDILLHLQKDLIFEA